MTPRHPVKVKPVQKKLIRNSLCMAIAGPSASRIETSFARYLLYAQILLPLGLRWSYYGPFWIKNMQKKIPRPFSGQSKFLIIKFNCDNFWNFSTPTYLSGQACRFFLMKRREPQMVTICAFLIKYSPGVYWALQAAS